MKKISIGYIILISILLIMSITYIIPLLLLVSISLSSESELVTKGYSLLPVGFTFDAYKVAFTNSAQIFQSYKITILYSIISTVLGILVQSAMAYPLARTNCVLKKPVIVLITITMLFSGGIVPSYIINTKYLNLGNSFWIYVFPVLFAAWNVIMYKTYFQSLPAGLIEAAKIDGASEYRIFFTMAMPLSKPIIATLGFTALLAQWNSWSTTSVYIRDTSLYSLQYLLQRLINEAEFLAGMQEEGVVVGIVEQPRESLRYSMAIIAAGPMMVVFPFFQKYFAKGLVVGSVKG